jgi:hypothetical protein
MVSAARVKSQAPGYSHAKPLTPSLSPLLRRRARETKVKNSIKMRPSLCACDFCLTRVNAELKSGGWHEVQNSRGG